jgi:thioredoxin-dependent peroxiredoxin
MSESGIIAPGTPAPPFELADQNGKIVSLKDYAGKWLVFYFYPKDSTPGCTIEANDFTRLAKDFKASGAEVVGVSPDNEKSHCRFIEKQGLTITLLSDPEHKVIEAYGAWQLKKFMGRENMGVVRSTWLINPEGKVAYTWSPVKVKDHAQEVLDKLKELK